MVIVYCAVICLRNIVQIRLCTCLLPFPVTSSDVQQHVFPLTSLPSLHTLKMALLLKINFYAIICRNNSQFLQEQRPAGRWKHIRLYQRLDSWWMHMVDYNKDFDLKNILNRYPTQTTRWTVIILSLVLSFSNIVALYYWGQVWGDIIRKCFKFSG